MESFELMRYSVVIASFNLIIVINFKTRRQTMAEFMRKTKILDEKDEKGN